MTDYINSINSTTLESDSFDDSFVNKMGVAVFTGATFTANQFKTYSLGDIIPNDGYDYEVQFECFSATSSTSGNSVECRLISGTEKSSSYPTDKQYATPGRAVTRVSNTQQVAGSCTLVIKSYDRNVTFNNSDGSGTSGTSSLYLHNIKRLGTNLISPNTSYISNVSTEGENLTIGGELLGGQWVDNYVSIASDISLGTSSVSGYSLADVLPNDGCTYEVLCSAWGRTGTTSGNAITLRVGTSSTPTGNCVVARQVTRTSSYMEIGGQVEILAKSTDNIYVANSSSNGTCTAVNLRVCAYRRVGTNNTTGSKNICIKSSSLIPNAIVYGNPTVSGNDVTDFSVGNYLDIPVTKYATATYIICFTTPSSTPPYIEAIYHCEKYFSVELNDSSKIVTFNNGTIAYTELFTPNINTKYWVKVEINGTSKTYSYSTNGTTYTTVTTITDTGVDTTAEFKQRLGNSSLGVRANTAFSGTVHLNECSITVNNQVVWEGMNYKKYLPIGGYIADGQWVRSDKSVYSGANISNGTHTYNITNYLPENDVQYEILCYARSNTAASSGSANKLWINRSDQVYGYPSISRVVCRSSSSVNDAKSCIIVCTQKNGVIPIIVEQISSSTTGACALSFSAYRRIGNNT